MSAIAEPEPVVKYPRKLRAVGMLREQCVLSVDMPRARFLELVAEELAQAREVFGTRSAAALRAELWPVAEAMPRFPLGSWLHAQRGCGCVVGEYLVATSELERACLVDRLIGQHVPMDQLLASNPLKGELVWFGYHIDTAVSEEIGNSFPDRYEYDGARAFSVELIDDEPGGIAGGVLDGTYDAALAGEPKFT